MVARWSHWNHPRRVDQGQLKRKLGHRSFHHGDNVNLQVLDQQRFRLSARLLGNNGFLNHSMFKKLDSPGPIGRVGSDQMIIDGSTQLNNAGVGQLDRMRNQNSISFAELNANFHRIENRA